MSLTEVEKQEIIDNVLGIVPDKKSIEKIYFENRVREAMDQMYSGGEALDEMLDGLKKMPVDAARFRSTKG